MQCAVVLLGLPLGGAYSAEGNLAKSAPVEIRAAKKLLFLPFYNEAADQNLTWLESSIGHSIHETANKKFKYEKIDDNDFTMYFINKGYRLSDLYDFAKITKIAHDLGVDGVIYGTFKPDEDRTNIVVTGKILSVIDKEVIAEKTVTMPVSAEMFSAVEEVSQALGDNIKNLFFPSDKGALVRAATLPGWGHRYKQRPGWGYFWGGLFWSGVSFTAFSTVQFVRFSIAYKNYNPTHYDSPGGGVGLQDPGAAQAEFDHYKSLITTWGYLTLGGIIGVGLIYAGNLLHAYNISPDVVDNPDITGAGKSARLKIDVRQGQRESILAVSLAWRF